MLDRAFSSRRMRVLAGWLAVLGLTLGAQAGTGPGGVGDTNGASNLRLWLKADAGVEQADGLLPAEGEKVAAWRDQSGYGVHAVQNTVNSRPIAAVSSLNGQPAVRFDPNDGTNDYMAMPHFMTFSNFTIFDVGVLLSATNSTMARMVFEVGGHSLYPKIQLRWHGSGNQYWMNVSDVLTNQFEYLNMGSVRTPHIGTHTLDGQTLRGYYNGVLKQTKSNTNYVPTAFTSNNTPRVG